MYHVCHIKFLELSIHTERKKVSLLGCSKVESFTEFHFPSLVSCVYQFILAGFVHKASGVIEILSILSFQALFLAVSKKYLTEFWWAFTEERERNFLDY